MRAIVTSLLASTRRGVTTRIPFTCIYVAAATLFIACTTASNEQPLQRESHQNKELSALKLRLKRIVADGSQTLTISDSILIIDWQSRLEEDDNDELSEILSVSDLRSLLEDKYATRESKVQLRRAWDEREMRMNKWATQLPSRELAECLLGTRALTRLQENAVINSILQGDTKQYDAVVHYMDTLCPPSNARLGRLLLRVGLNSESPPLGNLDAYELLLLVDYIDAFADENFQTLNQGKVQAIKQRYSEVQSLKKFATIKSKYREELSQWAKTATARHLRAFMISDFFGRIYETTSLKEQIVLQLENRLNTDDRFAEIVETGAQSVVNYLKQTTYTFAAIQCKSFKVADALINRAMELTPNGDNDWTENVPKADLSIAEHNQIINGVLTSLKDLCHKNRHALEAFIGRKVALDRAISLNVLDDSSNTLGVDNSGQIEISKRVATEMFWSATESFFDMNNRDSPDLTEPIDRSEVALRLRGMLREPSRNFDEGDFTDHAKFLFLERLYLGNLYFSLAHEIGHVVLGHTAERSSETIYSKELEADKFAAALLALAARASEDRLRIRGQSVHRKPINLFANQSIPTAEKQAMLEVKTEISAQIGEMFGQWLGARAFYLYLGRIYETHKQSEKKLISSYPTNVERYQRVKESFLQIMLQSEAKTNQTL